MQHALGERLSTESHSQAAAEPLLAISLWFAKRHTCGRHGPQHEDIYMCERIKHRNIYTSIVFLGHKIHNSCKPILILNISVSQYQRFLQSRSSSYLYHSIHKRRAPLAGEKLVCTDRRIIKFKYKRRETFCRTKQDTVTGIDNNISYNSGTA
jgi:hypothetical protein